MAIISISLNDNLLKSMDELSGSLGFSGRSELIRAAIRNMISEEKAKEKLSGNTQGVLLVVNQEETNDDVSKIRHKYNDIIKTQVHNHLDSEKCLQIFVIEGDASKVKGLLTEFQACRKVEYSKFIAA